MTVIAALDGTLLPSDRPLLFGDDPGVLRGDGVFETVLVVDGQPRDFDHHLVRLANSARLTGIPLPDEIGWRRAGLAVTEAWAGDRQMSLRLIVIRGAGDGPATCYTIGAAVPATSLRQRSGARVLLLDRGFSAGSAAAAPWLLAGAKSLSYAVNMAAIRHAVANGADDVIFVGSDGAILEGATATVVVASGRTLTTPPADGILQGITARRLFEAASADGFATEVRTLTPRDLDTADGVWLVSSLRVLAPVIGIDGRPRPVGPQHADLARLLDLP